VIIDRINALLNSEGKTISDAILDEVAQLSRWTFARQFGEREDRPGTLRLSSIGKCIRQQAYKLLKFPEDGKKIDARARMVFAMGDLTELVVVGLAKAAGCIIEATGDKQASVEIDGVPGHPDGVLIDSGKRYLLEIKSMSSFSFRDFERGVIDEGYRYQCNAYMAALNLDKCVIVALNKDAGVLAEQVISLDPTIVADIRSRIILIRQAKIDSLPPRPYKPDAKGFYPWPCLYCQFHNTCLPNAEKVLVSNKYKLKEKLNVPTPKTKASV
jgi:hypothetical protein